MKKSKIEQEREAEATGKFLENIVTEFFRAVNVRNFDPGAPPWDRMSEWFQAQKGPARPKLTSKRELMAFFKEFSKCNPGHNLQIYSFSTKVDLRAGWATVTVNTNTTGVPGIPIGSKYQSLPWGEFRCFAEWYGSGAESCDVYRVRPAGGRVDGCERGHIGRYWAGGRLVLIVVELQVLVNL